MGGFVTFCFTAGTPLVCVPFGIYSIVIGILGIVFSSHLRDDVSRQGVPTWLAVMMICNVLTGDFITMIFGIIAIVKLNDAQVVRSFRR